MLESLKPTHPAVTADDVDVTAHRLLERGYPAGVFYAAGRLHRAKVGSRKFEEGLRRARWVGTYDVHLLRGWLIQDLAAAGVEVTD